ncbi:hypothetical protein FRC18_010449 [Serendipita sp. 400]|nr:hypothetical protein FRC18_010449 [Serendipita sp. 400]
MASLNVTQVQQPKAKQKPSLDTLVFTYSSSQDGVDENLLILFHGFGDTHIPFVKLAKSLKLPQTATLAIRAPELAFNGIQRILPSANCFRIRIRLRRLKTLLACSSILLKSVTGLLNAFISSVLDKVDPLLLNSGFNGTARIAKTWGA